MVVKQFQAESQRLLDMMIHSIYSQKEVFLRELISNASDAIDKIYYKALTDDTMTFNKEDYYIQIIPNKEDRTLKIIDTGIGMTKEELEENLGTIAKSGSLAFKRDNEKLDEVDIIGQFGVGFYSAFMIADQVKVVSKALGSEQAYIWESQGTEGYTINECTKDSVGTEITLYLKENNENDSFDQYLEEYELRTIIKKYSDFIRYPINLLVEKVEAKEDSEETETVKEFETVNSMIPIWKKNKSELTDEDFEKFYQEKRYGFGKPLKHIFTSVDGMISYHAILYIPDSLPFDYYSKEYEKGLELYSNGVLIMNKCSDLIPDHFSFVKGLVDSQDLSLNISREMLQQDQQVQKIAKNITKKIKSELLSMQKNDEEKYNQFFETFGRQLKFGIYNDFGMNRKDLEDLLMFYSSTEKKLVSLASYVERMKEDQKYIYYAVGSSYDKIARLPQTERVEDLGYEVLYFKEDIDEFAIKVLMNYKEKEFKSVASGDLGLPKQEEEQAEEKAYEEMLDEMKKILDTKVSKVAISKHLKSHPVCLTAEGEISIEMEKVLSQMPDGQLAKAQKILEINESHPMFTGLKSSFESDKDKFELYTKILFDQALILEGLEIEDPMEYANRVCQLMN